MVKAENQQKNHQNQKIKRYIFLDKQMKQYEGRIFFQDVARWAHPGLRQMGERFAPLSSHSTLLVLAYK